MNLAGGRVNSVTKVVQMARAFERPAVQYILLVMIVLTAGTLRFYKLGAWGFWLDEIYTVRNAEALSALDMTPYIWDADQSNFPLSFMLVRLSSAMFGESEWSARFFFALISVLSIPLFYFLIRAIFNPSVALLSVLFLAIAPWHIYWSQNARYYALVFFLSNLSLLLFYLGAEKNKAGYLALSGLCFGLSVLTHPAAAIVAPIFVLYPLTLKLLRFSWPPGINLKTIAIFGGVGAIILFAYFDPIHVLFDDILRIETDTGQSLDRVIPSAGSGDPLRFLLGVNFFIGLYLTGFGIFSAAYLIFYQRSRPAVLFAVSAIVPVLLLVIISVVRVTFNRYTFPVLLSWHILGAAGLVALWKSVKSPERFLVAGLVVIFMLLPMAENFLYFRYQNGNRENWRDAFAYVNQHRNPDDLIVVSFPAAGEYYLEQDVLWSAQVQPDDVIESNHQVWFVLNNAIEWGAPIHSWVKENAQNVADFDVVVNSARTYNMHVYLYTPE